MAKNYYGCIPALAWLLCHYFYNREHYVWVAERFYPYRLPNPRSSNPHRIYEDLYEPWMDADNFDKYISQTRLSLRNGVEAKEKSGVIMPADATRLKKICDKVEVTFFCPIVLRLDIDQIDGARRKTAGSGASVGSHEYLIPDLRENEFDILFLDVIQDPAVQQLVVDEIAGTSGGTAPADAMDLLETRLLP